ncbi:hypothetical protein PAXRUDRAFT_176503 [Paxillus rubicundulus Ve08.2h10]|uniref:HTH CENPB-type domain-containing protein n=1 Tax=Paxillus rubicundulus Ve08.2h10 TaxID=930991 RepID=A0A0D0D2M1_9AGAM|nr:hypothetical protein PAXRUDRAFT_176503 [Paxillus rubicundulus Ve08.2h10]
MPSEKRKPRDKPAQYNQPAKKQNKKQELPSTSAQLAQSTTRSNLTLSDWMTVFAYVDSHPTTPQNSIVNHFRTLKSGPLVFTQATLSRKLHSRLALEARVNDNPNALSSKRPRIVTRPDVEQALILWVRQMENKGEMVSGPMLQEK